MGKEIILLTHSRIKNVCELYCNYFIRICNHGVFDYRRHKNETI